MFVLHETRETHKTKRNETKSNKTVALKEIVCSAKKKKKRLLIIQFCEFDPAVLNILKIFVKP